MWLDAMPSSHHFILSNDDFLNAVCLSLGRAIPSLQSLNHCIPQCGPKVDIKAYHAITCKWGGGPIHRHDAALDCFFKCQKFWDSIIASSYLPSLLTNSGLT